MNRFKKKKSKVGFVDFWDDPKHDPDSLLHETGGNKEHSWLFLLTSWILTNTGSGRPLKKFVNQQIVASFLNHLYFLLITLLLLLLGRSFK